MYILFNLTLMKKILTTTEKWAYAHWCVWPYILWPINPCSWIAVFLALLNLFTWTVEVRNFLNSILPQSEWYCRTGHATLVTLFALLCFATSFALVYFCARVCIFWFDKDEFYQKFYKRYILCKNRCLNCLKKDCPAQLEIN